MFKIILDDFFLLFYTSFFIFSCSSKNEKLEFALQQAENNRKELEKVLNHYKNGSLKYKSAIFLIENMPYYAYQISPQIDSTKNLLSKIFEKWDLTEVERQKGIYFQQTSQPTIKQDIKEIKANLLIENIDYAFRVWQEKPWNKHLSFENFCELILPYRIAEEPLTNWRKTYYEKYNPILDSLYKGTDVVEACNILSDYMKTEKFFYFTDFSTPRQGADFQLKNRIGTCRDACDIATYVMRSVGIPVTTDMYLYSPEYQIDHEWNVVRDTTGKYLPFWYEQFNAVRDENFTDKRKKGKVFRMTYGIQKNLNKLEELPPSLQNPFLKDVTAQYFGKNSVTIPIENEVKNAFLGVFTARNGWLPVGEGMINDKEILFKNIEPFVIYQPLTYKNGILKPISLPFMYKKDKIHIFNPENQLQNVTLTRKYAMRKNTVVKYKNWLKKIKIKASNQPNFSKNEVLFEMKQLPPGNVINIIVNNTKSYRYFQYEVPKDSTLSIAEIHFLGKENKEIAFDTIFSNGKPWKDIDLYQLKNAFDNDPISFFHTWEMGTSIFFHSKTPKKVEKIQLIPRNDDNFIREGDTYELFYNAGARGWVSLGEKTATSESFLMYKAPKNAVLWLKNKTRGKEEQIFTYEDERQVFPTFEEYGK
ncbi:hypothetical protein [Capnocytophaga cynodegmi]|uniref:Peptide-N(4)-(N-acetyl-beta-glucosaminyl)asparagine amidase n=1 Tax=Capnocytophaga cynodegmi TaxID=28189 RepID=A0A0B7HBQ5_9FLAO|nr:hypothetical protein [Capnocytophaga cynodegmi]CEN36700.1 conserved hypothetical protein [Capnocytophaga cynodegmi]